MIVKRVKIYIGLSLMWFGGIVDSVHFRLVPWSGLYFSRSIGPFLCSRYQPRGFNRLPVASKAVPSVIASSVCWSLQCLISTLI